MFTTSDIAKAICHSIDKNEQLRLQALLLVNVHSVGKIKRDIHCNK